MKKAILIMFVVWFALLVFAKGLNAQTCGRLTLCDVPADATNGSWQTYQGSYQHTGVQLMRGNFHCGSTRTLWTFSAGNWIIGQAVAGDIDNDGLMEVVVGSYDGNVYALRGTNGSVKWSRNVGSVAGECTPSIADVDNDGQIEVIVSTWAGNIYVLNGTTGVTEFLRNIGGTFACSTVGDVNANGLPDVVVSSDDGNLYAWTPLTNTILWTAGVGASDGSIPALVQLDRDACLEIIEGGIDTNVEAVDGCTGAIQWSSNMGCDMYSNPPSVSDIDNDGDMDIVIGSNCSRFHFIDGPTGMQLSGSPFTSSETYNFPTAAIYDVDGNGIVDVFKAARFSYLYRFNGLTRSVVWQRWTYEQYPVGEIIADINPTIPGFEVLTASFRGNAYILNSADGSVLWSGTAVGNLRNISVADVDNDNRIEIILTGENSPQVAVIDDNCPLYNDGDLAVDEGLRGSENFDILGKNIVFKGEGNVLILDVSGRVVFKGRVKQGHKIALGKGIYFVNFGNKTAKVAITR